MNVSSTPNQSQSLQTQRHPVTLPTQPQDPTYSNKEVYEASQGNITRSQNGQLELTPQGESNVNNTKNNAADVVAAEVKADDDATRGVAVDYLAASSQKSQVEIYLAVATDGKSSANDQTADVISELREVQKQNNAVEAYATYKEAQQSGNPVFS
ncbi:hypothetical protein MNB_SM-4-1497 [hydrothermal vent metagenome]|uniref:Uncharacterized protein n=1 Tax=hydrothermal vent metagenome TaxID=652676 RepID=A0A1W1BPB1_9ZZZZ